MSALATIDLPPRPPELEAPAAAVEVEIVIPVFNEKRVLEGSIRRLHAFLTQHVPFSWRILIADNGSTDGTDVVARRLSYELPAVQLLRLRAKGRGRALRAAWSTSRAEVLCYMDVDLSTDLGGLLPLVAPLLSGDGDLAIGTRLHRDARVRRSLKRELISRSYNCLLRLLLRARFSDAQCGFKAIRGELAHELLPVVADEEWFFDTELLIAAQRRGVRIHEVPVDWVEDRDSRVRIVATALSDLRGIARLLLNGPSARVTTPSAGRAILAP
jgi:glycosyltransferase involved in cell wall biosynthesis